MAKIINLTVNLSLNFFVAFKEDITYSASRLYGWNRFIRNAIEHYFLLMKRFANARISFWPGNDYHKAEIWSRCSQHCHQELPKKIPTHSRWQTSKIHHFFSQNIAILTNISLLSPTQFSLKINQFCRPFFGSSWNLGTIWLNG